MSDALKKWEAGTPAAPAPRVRNTASTARRVENIKRLLDVMDGCEMMALDICDLFNFSRSGGRKYIRDLMSARVIEIVGYADKKSANHSAEPIYRRSPDAELVRAYIAMIDLPGPAPRAVIKHKPKNPKSGNGSNFHILADDKHFMVKPDRRPAVRDPLVAAFFGPARGSAS